MVFGELTRIQASTFQLSIAADGPTLKRCVLLLRRQPLHPPNHPMNRPHPTHSLKMWIQAILVEVVR